MHGIAKDSYNEVAAQLGICQIAAERAYCVAFDTLDLISNEVLRNAVSNEVLCSADVSAGLPN